MDDNNILSEISALVEREHWLREHRADGTMDGPTEAAELEAANEKLDQCWDLLRQRHAKREFDQDADTAAVRSTSVVEHYWQ